MASQFFCRIIWPRDRSSSELIASNEEHLSNYPETSKKIIVFDKYQDISAKAHDRMQQKVELYSSALERCKKKKNPISENLPTSKVASILARLLHQGQPLIVFYDEADWSVLLAGSSQVRPKCDLHT